MFTGIIQDIGEIASIDKKGDWRVSIATKLAADNLALGASVACNGICVTVVDRTADRFEAQLSAETLSKTTAIHWRAGTRLNLERALRAGDELGGHIVSGHVDGVARIIEKRIENDSLRFQFETPKEFARFLAPKGSVAIDGISLTVNDVDGPRFGVNIIPYTQKLTTIADAKLGDEVNFEVDMIARYVARMLNDRAAP